MKFTTAVIAAACAGLSAAQSLSSLPACAQTCATNAIPASCGIDVQCICSSTSFIAGVTCCVATSCDAADQEATQQFAAALCSGAGVTNLPTVASCAASSAVSSTSLSSSAATGAAVSSAISSAASVASSAFSSESSAAAAASTSTTASVASSSTAASTTASSSASAASATSSGSAANRFVAQGFGMAGLIAAAVAMI